MERRALLRVGSRVITLAQGCAIGVLAYVATSAFAQGDAPERELPPIKAPAEITLPSAPVAEPRIEPLESEATHWTPSADGAFLPYEAAWPARAVKQGERLQGVIKTIDAPVLTRRAQRAYWPLVAEPDDRADALALRDAAGMTREPNWNFEGPGYLIFRFEAPIAADAAPREIEVFKFISGRTLKKPAGADDVPTLAVERTWFSFYPAKNATVRGTALVMPGLWGTPEPIIDSTVASLRREGWAVVRMLSQPSRFTEQVEFSIDAGEIAAAADRIAEVYNQRAAECAYAVEAAFDHVLRRHPELAKLPRVAVGMSGGAITLPTVVAREAEKYAAAVIVAGAADLWLTSSRSAYDAMMVHALDVTWVGGTPDTKTQQMLDREYLASAPLDPYHTAAALRNKPVLMVHATADLAVPSDLGDVLWERLGKPKRITMDVGHELLFMNMPKMLPQVMEFLRAASGKPGAGTAEAAKPAGQASQ